MRTLLVALTLLAAPLLARAEPPGLEHWQHRHPEAARELGDWVRAHPHAAERLFTWDGHHPERSREFVTWTIEHPREGVDAFVRHHRGWEYFDELIEHHRPGTEAFMAWCRRHPRAAEDLIRHPRGLEWAGQHLYREHAERERHAR